MDQSAAVQAARVSVAQVIGFVESGNAPTALRFEPRVYARDKNPLTLSRVCRANNCSIATAEVLYSFSFGEFQIMGFELYGPTIGYAQPIANYISGFGDQLSTFNQFLTADKLDGLRAIDLLNPRTRANFAQLYNGPDNVDQYSARILSALNHFGVTQS